MRFLVPDLDATQEQIGSAFAGQFVEKDDLVAPDGAARGQGAAFHDAIVGVVLHASDEEDAVSVERGKPGIVVVAAVEDHDGSGLETEGGGDAALVHAPGGDDGIAGQQPLMIEQQMQLDGAFGAPVLRPVEDGGAQLDQGGVQAQQLVLEAEAVCASNFARLSSW